MTSPARAARAAKRELASLARPAGAFDARRYFRDAGRLGFYNVGADRVRELARRVVLEHRDIWTLGDALAFADCLIRDRYLEAKGVGIEALAQFRRDFTPRLLTAWKGWLADNHADNWATTDLICGMLIGPLLVAHPGHAARVAAWSSHRNLWVRRASIVGLIPLARRGTALDTLYRAAGRLHADREDLIQKAVGWALREAGKADMKRLEGYLRANGRRIPRTTLRYAIERFSPAERKDLLAVTKASAALRPSPVRPARRRPRVDAR